MAPRTILPTLALLLILATPTSAQPDRIVVAGGDRFVPILFRNARGEPDGIDAEYWRLWSKKTGVEVELRLMDWAEAIPALLRGEVDVVDGVTKTPERIDILDFTPQYDAVATYVFFHEDLGGVRGLEDLAGFPVGVVEGSNTQEHLEREAPSLVPVPYVNHEALVAAALAGKIRVFVSEEPMISYFLAQEGAMCVFRRTERPILEGELRMAVRKGRSELLALVEDGLRRISPEERERIRKAWTGVAAIPEPIERWPWRWILAGLGIVLIGGVLLGVWNWSLRRRVERATRTLRRSEERYRGLVEHSPVPIIVHSDERVVLANRRAIEVLGGSDSEEFVGLSIWEAMHPEDKIAVAERIDRVYRKKEPAPLREVKLVRRDGEVIQVEAVATPIELEGRPASQVVFTDITERKLLEAQLLQSQKLEAIGQLAGGVAHDFNNLLQAITGYTMIAQSKITPDHPAQPGLTEVQKAAERAASLTRQLLAFGRRETVRPEHLDVNVIVSELTAMLRRGIPADVELELRLDPDLRTILADRVQVEQVVMNLCLNARDAMPRGGSILVETRDLAAGDSSRPLPPEFREGGAVAIVVRDTGEGMSAKVRARIFDPFFTTKAAGHGTGLGLTTVLAIAQRWGGAIELETEPGRGTEFRVLLPPSEGKRRESEKPTEETPLDGQGETILLAEDDELVRNLAIEVLRGAGYRTLVATDGDEAIRLVESHAGELALAIVDVVMPKKSGREVHDVLQARAPHVPVLFSSGYSRDSMAQEQLPAGDIQLVQKPYPPREFLVRVRETLRDRPS